LIEDNFSIFSNDSEAVLVDPFLKLNPSDELLIARSEYFDLIEQYAEAKTGREKKGLSLRIKEKKNQIEKMMK